jgi:hypothetical protein
MALLLFAAPAMISAQTVTYTFSNQPFAEQSAQFVAEFDATPLAPTVAPVVAVVGFSDDPANSFAQMSTIMRFNRGGTIDAINGRAYDAATAVPYQVGFSYHFRVEVNVPAATYNVFVKPLGSNTFVTIGQGLAFYVPANNVFNLDSLVTTRNSLGESVHVDNLVVSTISQSVNPNCTLVVPDNPLTAEGLATPYQLKGDDDGPCQEADLVDLGDRKWPQSAFVQAGIIDTDTGQISIYNPLVITQGDTPAVAPQPPVLPAHYVAALWFGYNGGNLTLEGAGNTLAANHCVNGFNGSLFGQYSYCNAVAFFAAANNAIKAGQLLVPPLGFTTGGQVCPSVRSFEIVDQDQSDNVTSTFLLVTTQGAPKFGLVAQDTAANRAQLASEGLSLGTKGNPSDNRLLDNFVDKALGCDPWKVRNLAVNDLTDPNANVPALPLNELQAAAFQQPPIALVPFGDPMTTFNGFDNLAKTNAYRRGVDQPPAATPADGSTKTYCRNFRAIHPTFLDLNSEALKAKPSPFPDESDTLLNFMCGRAVDTYSLLKCEPLLQKPDRIHLTKTGEIITGCTIDPLDTAMPIGNSADAVTDDLAGQSQ